MPRRLDISGDSYGKLTVIQYSHQDRHKKSQWWVQCDCGICFTTSGAAMRKGNTLSCGCVNKEHIRNLSKTHGGCGKGVGDYHPNYATWIGMIQRCTSPKNTHYGYYGGRGIRVCEQWLDALNGLDNFTRDLGVRPSKKHSLDRIDSNDNYTPENCRWSLPSEQAYNQRKRKNNTTGRTGVYPEKSNGTYWVGICEDGKFNRVMGGLSFEKACEVRTQEEIRIYGYSKE